MYVSKILLSCLLLGPCQFEIPVSLTKLVTPEVLTQLVEQLGSASFNEREAASARLREQGDLARPALINAITSESAEIRSRATDLLKHLDFGAWETACSALAKLPDERIDLEEGIWLISCIRNPTLTQAELSKPLDQLAARVRQELGAGLIPAEVDPHLVVEAIRKVLFLEEGFDGNRDDYQNPDNSSLARVLETKLGLPIVLSHLVIAVGRRLEVPLVGVPAPYRYLVRYDRQKALPEYPPCDLLLDPFSGGRLVSDADRAQLFPGVDPEVFHKRDTKREVLIRMLTNLETHLFNRDETELAVRTLGFRLLLIQSANEKNHRED